MFIKTAALALVSALVVAVAPAKADSWRSDIREDFREVQKDRAKVVGDSARLLVERRELEEARARLRADWRNGNFDAIRRDELRVRREAADVHEAQAQLNATRAKLGRDVRDLREDFREHGRHHRYD